MSHARKGGRSMSGFSMSENCALRCRCLPGFCGVRPSATGVALRIWRLGTGAATDEVLALRCSKMSM